MIGLYLSKINNDDDDAISEIMLRILSKFVSFTPIRWKFKLAISIINFDKLHRIYMYIFISPQIVDNKQYEKKNKNKQK